MPNQNIGNIRVQSLKGKLNDLDFNHHVNTSCSFTDVQPIVNVMCYAGDKPKVKIEQLCWLAPIVSPVFGCLRYHNWHYFVKMSDLSNNFAAMMTKTRVSRSSTFIPAGLPHMRKGLLSLLPFFESHCTVWASDAEDYDYSATYKLPGAAFGATSVPVVDDLVNAGILTYSNNRGFDGISAYAINMRKILSADLFKYANGNAYSASISYNIPLNNRVKADFVDCRHNDNTACYDGNGVGINESPVYLKTADYVIEHVMQINGVNRRIAFAFRFSDFGKRLKKVLEGSGIRLDLSDTTDYNIMQLFAVYKAYFDVFGILQYQNWEDTAAAKILYASDNYNEAEFSLYLGQVTWGDAWKNDLQVNILQFIKDLSFMYTTDSVNFVSAHTQQAAVTNPEPLEAITAPDVNSGLVPPINMPSSNRGTDGSPAGTITNNVNNHAFINSAIHGQMDAELLKKLLLTTNLETVAGQRLIMLARLRGLGDFVDKMKVQFIGHTAVDIKFETVTSQSDTAYVAGSSPEGDDIVSGSQLGQRGAKAQCYSEGKTFKYKCSEIGYYVVLASIVPDASYCQQDDARNEQYKYGNFYQRVYDGVGVEATRKSNVCGELLWVNPSDISGKPLAKTFGFLPRSSKFKIMQSKTMGDFSLRSRRDYYLTFILDKVIDLGQHAVDVDLTADGGSTPANRLTTSHAVLSFGASRLPIAGESWRYTARYPWLGHLYRIFSTIGDNYRNYSHPFSYWTDNGGNAFYEFMSLTYDNFLLQHDIKFDVQSQRLQIGDSYETKSDGNEGSSDTNISHA